METIHVQISDIFPLVPMLVNPTWIYCQFTTVLMINQTDTEVQRCCWIAYVFQQTKWSAIHNQRIRWFFCAHARNFKQYLQETAVYYIIRMNALCNPSLRNHSSFVFEAAMLYYRLVSFCISAISSCPVYIIYMLHGQTCNIVSAFDCHFPHTKDGIGLEWWFLIRFWRRQVVSIVKVGKWLCKLVRQQTPELLFKNEDWL